jgi:hypothetical protein
MNRSSLLSRTPANLPESTHQRLNKYALAASAAGVGLLALAQSAEARIVYTPAHVKISNQKIALDLNHDGKTDFSFLQSFFTTTSVGEYSQDVLTVAPVGSNQVWGGVTGTQLNPHYAAALAAGVRVGPKGQFSNHDARGMAWFGYGHGTGGSGTCGGHWFDVKNRYVGLEFVVKGKRHFGWARLSVSCTTAQRQPTGVLTGYAYETIPNKAIVTGKTKGPDDEGGVEQVSSASAASSREAATVGFLALGAPGLCVWRREEA